MANDPSMAPSKALEVKAHRQKMLVGLILMGGTLAIMATYVTQSIAADCNYNPLLGSNWEVLGYHIYPPWRYMDWFDSPELNKVIPAILNQYRLYPIAALALGFLMTYAAVKSIKTDISHGSAEFAKEKDIIEADLGQNMTKNGGVFVYDKKPLFKIFGHQFYRKKKVRKDSGVVIGIDPFTKKLMLHNGPEHILLMAPTRSGKGINTIIPTGITWKNSIFFFDPKGELWANTSWYRKNILHQKVMKFEPLCIDGSTNRWNPLAEINFMTNEEISDVSTVVSVMVKPDGEKQGGSDPFWDNAAANLLNGVIMHLLYKHYKEKLPLPCPTDIMSFLSSPDKDTDELFEDMMTYPHITPEQFLEEEYEDIKYDSKGNPVLGPDGKPEHETKRYMNPFLRIYGKFYVKDINRFNDALSLEGKDKVHDIEELQHYLQKLKKEKPEEFKKIDWDTRDPDDDEHPFHMLLTHPRVAESAANMKNGAEQTRASIMQTAQTSLGIYQDPVVQENTKVSDFCIRDLLDPSQEVSCYLVMQVKDIATVKPISRLFVNTLLNKLIRDMKFGDNTPAKKQRLLLMLDEFPQLGKMESVELALAICAGYGIKICIVCQDVNQLNKAYTKDNSIASNCHVHIYFTPNLDPGGATAKAISETLGKMTIKSVSHSDGGGGIGKGSDSISSQARELMTPDEVAKMSTESELVFVAGHKPILGRKLRFYLEPFFQKRVRPSDTPKLSDPVTTISTYPQLFAIHKADTDEREERRRIVREAKEERAKEEAERRKRFLKKLQEQEEAKKKQPISLQKDSPIPLKKEPEEQAASPEKTPKDSSENLKESTPEGEPREKETTPEKSAAAGNSAPVQDSGSEPSTGKAVPVRGEESHEQDPRSSRPPEMRNPSAFGFGSSRIRPGSRYRDERDRRNAMQPTKPDPGWLKKEEPDKNLEEVKDLQKTVEELKNGASATKEDPPATTVTDPLAALNQGREEKRMEAQRAEEAARKAAEEEAARQAAEEEQQKKLQEKLSNSFPEEQPSNELPEQEHGTPEESGKEAQDNGTQE